MTWAGANTGMESNIIGITPIFRHYKTIFPVISREKAILSQNMAKKRGFNTDSVANHD